MTVTPRSTTTAISLDTAAIISERSKRTWQRRLAEGEVIRLADDARGRSMVCLTDVAALICIPLQGDDVDLLLEADAGSAAAQRDLGQLFASHEKYEIAVHWLRQAAEQGDADAMQCLGAAHAAGEGVAQDNDLALMWVARSAAQGHVIARAQTRGLLSCGS
ncbi:tetratricopeptide repeat protein [Variovorax boronicumulans]|uniref:tetratricopeptide repeat protein n=1 Tax=Variovorax boronicumulans TaxID=436515 RepID=UPI001C58B96A